MTASGSTQAYCGTRFVHPSRGPCAHASPRATRRGRRCLTTLRSCAFFARATSSQARQRLCCARRTRSGSVAAGGAGIFLASFTHTHTHCAFPPRADLNIPRCPASVSSHRPGGQRLRYGAPHVQAQRGLSQVLAAGTLRPRQGGQSRLSRTAGQRRPKVPPQVSAARRALSMLSQALSPLPPSLMICYE